MIIDTHCHLDFEQFDADRNDVIERAKKAGVLYMINVSSSIAGSLRGADLASNYDNIFATCGIHPHHSGEEGEERIKELEKLAANKKVVAIGEVGLDYVKSKASPETQKKIFIRLIGIAKNLGLPLIVHSRNAHKDTLDILEKHHGASLRGVMHCFSGDESVRERALELGLYISFTCNLTFKNAKTLRGIASGVPLERLLLETDSPYLAPESRRGARNEPSYITELRDCVAGIFGLPENEVEERTTDNAKRLFKLDI